MLTAGDWRDAHTVDLDDACVLAIKATDIGSFAGILASTSTGVVTDDTWKCSAEEESGWHLPDFDDAAWAQARVTWANGGSSSRFPGIISHADWIWVDSASIVYCWKRLC